MRTRIEKRQGVMSWLRGGLGAAALAGLVSCAGGVDDGSPVSDNLPELIPSQPAKPDATIKAAPYKEGTLLVRFKRNAEISVQNTVHRELGATVMHTFSSVRNLYAVELPEGLSVEEAMARYKRNPEVANAEPNFIYTLDQTIPDDPDFPDMFGLNNTGQTGGADDADIDAPEAWDITTGSEEVVIAVLDSGIDYNHEDLAANVFVNLPEFEGTPGVDDDGNGYIDDIHGINTRDDSGDPDSQGDAHGTHVSGTIAAVGNNGIGVTGVNWTSRILSCKAFTNTATLVDIIECLDYFHEMKTRSENPVNIIASNNSWGGGGFSQELYNAIQAQAAAGILFVAAAGNSGVNTDTSAHFPSSYDLPSIISVLASTDTDERASFSNFGALTVDVGAPGADILSTVPGSDYAVFSGTSMATPHVTGLVGLLKADDQSRTIQQIKNLILTGGDETPGTDGTVLTGRRINAFGSLNCVDQVLNNRFAPSEDSVVVGTGIPVTLGMLSINCDQPNPANFVVEIAETGQTIPLVDPSGTGEFTAEFTPFQVGTFTLNFVQNGTVVDTVSVSAVGNYDPPRLVAAECREFEGTPIALGDDAAQTIVSDFPIPFAGAQPGLTDLSVGSNGVLSFSGGITTFSNQALPSTARETIIAPYWDDLNPNSGGEVVFATLGEAPNREFVVEYRNINHYLAIAAITFQVVFTEGSPNIVFNYCDVTFEDDDALSGGASATLGVQATDGVAQQFSFNTVSVADGDALLFSMGAPFASAGPDQVVAPGANVTLNGSGSDDADGVIVRYTWTQTAGTPVTLTGADSPIATFTAPATSGTLTFELEVEDDEGQTATDTVDIIVNLAPVAEAGDDFQIANNVQGTLDCSESFDPDGEIVAYQWVQLGGDDVEVISDGSPVATFIAPDRAPQFLVFQCTVTDDLGFVDSDVVVGQVYFNAAPIAEAGNDQIVAPGSTVTLDATGSTDDEGTIASFQWEVMLCMTIDGPCELALDDATAATPSFVAPESRGFAHIALSIVDADGAGSSDSVVIYFANQPPEVVAAVEPECASPGDLVTLTAACVDPDGTVASIQWTQTAGTPVELSGADTDTATFTAPASADPLSFEATCTDDSGLDASAEVSLSINAAPVADAVCSPLGVPEGGTVSCTASASQNAVDFTWASPTDPGLEIPPGENTSFSAPNVDGFRIVTIELTASNVCGSTDTDTFDIVVISQD
ncbi:S8 family peptidase [Haliangium ochraceum]|uniref:Peptidase S8 and S53 subtilisin kexin sedolisin n=1 Tax=Haliangium ochraceum (strain DSM 14365 / JCM 11303 / SMP-2) TaxID=502025 RepID=D0LLA4_HALO1|nr:S8 family peptidase [Haliangium ochraceum]ACY18600.1 peptidase S8 and S53 subtilisin kexin sedolisin [Haliangium ochraceum DSM 14365]